MDNLDIYLLSKVHNLVRDSEQRNVDIRPLAEEVGLDIDAVMEEVAIICTTGDYFVGGHVFCTRENVLPQYQRDGSLKLDSNHVEGLYKILQVDRGLIEDF
jgi:hypothetical protein